MSSRVAILALLLAAMAQRSEQHGYLLYPESRNYQASVLPADSDPSKCWCPHCGQGGGTGKMPSMCGDPFQNVQGDASWTPFTQRFYRYTTLSQGQTLNVRIAMSTNHGGRMSLSICPLSRDKVTQDCFNQPQYQLRRVNADPKYNNKRYWYLTSANGASAEETFRLPAGIACPNGCMIQWWWVGYQNCVMPCGDTATDDVPGECATNMVNPGVGKCTSVLQTEQFYNCGDVVITGSGGTGPIPTTVASPPPPAARTLPSPPPARLPSPSPPAGGSSGGCAAGDSACQQCAAASTNADIVKGCTTCVSKGLPSWACVQQCAQVASSATQMTGCTACLGATGTNSWGCQNCLTMAKGDATKSAQCFTCVMSGKDPWTCGQCLNKSNYGACYSCLNTAGSNTYPCIA